VAGRGDKLPARGSGRIPNERERRSSRRTERGDDPGCPWTPATPSAWSQARGFVARGRAGLSERMLDPSSRHLREAGAGFAPRARRRSLPFGSTAAAGTSMQLRGDEQNPHEPLLAFSILVPKRDPGAGEGASAPCNAWHPSSSDQQDSLHRRFAGQPRHGKRRAL